MAQFPSSIISFSTKVNGQVIDASDINSPQNEITALEAKVGVDGSASVTSLDYIIKNPASDGGGHVQTANKGGTGQITFAKGDLLVATSSSVISKLAVGNDGLGLVADSTQTSGLKWGTPTGIKIFASVLSSVVAQNTVNESSIFSQTLPGSVLGINNAVRATINVLNFGFHNTLSSVLLFSTYGGARVSSVFLSGQDLSSGGGLKGKLIYTLYGNGTSNNQGGDLEVSLARNLSNQSSVTGIFDIQSGVASVLSSANANMGMTVKYSTAETTNKVLVGGIVIEKIA